MIYLLLTWLAAPVLWMLARVGRPANPRRILLIQTAKIGDLACTTPLLPQLRARFPQARLSMLVAAETRPLVAHSPLVDEVLTLPKSGGLRMRLALLALLRRHSFDMTICASPNQAMLLAPFWATIPWRLSILPDRPGRSYRLAAHFLTAAETHRPGRMTLETLFALLVPFGVAPSLAKHIVGHPEGRARVAAVLGESGRRLIGMGISAGNKLKELPLDVLAEIATGLLVAPDCELLLIGGPGEESRAQELLARLPVGRARSLVGRLALDEVPALMERLSLYVGVDSGITYIADGCGVPVIDLMGPADPDDQRPTGVKALVVRPAAACAPCSHAFDAPYTCRTGTHACLRTYNVTVVVGQGLERIDTPLRRDCTR